MPNLTPPVISARLAIEYRQRIMDALEPGLSIDPQMALYLTDNTRVEDVIEAKNTANVVAFKWYPAGATTNSDSGVTNVENILPALAEMEKQDLILCVHGEVTDCSIDIFDREAVFIEQVLQPIVKKFPNLRIIFEHITTADAVEFVKAQSDNVAATVTAHHLLFNRNDMLAGGIRPHYYCLPILKRNIHQQALLDAVASGNKKFFIGTDSAPHLTSAKEASCGCAGAYTAFHAMELYAEAFESVNALDKLEGFASFYGADFYRLPRNKQIITLEKQTWQLPENLSMRDSTVTPILSGENIHWKKVP